MHRNRESVVACVAGWSESRPDAACIVDRNGMITYGEAWREVCRYAAGLREYGVFDGDYVLTECTQDRRFLLLDLACELLGAVFVPLERGCSRERRDTVLSETEAKLLLTEQDAEAACRHETVASFVDRLPRQGIRERTFPVGDTVAEILYTTGTTGLPKGIEITHLANVALAENIIYGVEMRQDNMELIPLPVSHSHGLRCSYANLVNGSAVVLMEGVTPILDFFSVLDRYPVTAMDLSPSAVLILMKLSRGKLSEYRDRFDYVQVGTAKLGTREKDYLRVTFPDARLYYFYGSTESGRTCVIDFNRIRKGEGCIGTATKHAHILVTDEKGEEMVSSRDRMGLLAFSGEMNMRGYFKHPELTATVLRNGIVYSGDLGYIDEDGAVFIMGRQGDIINRGGIKIAPEEVEGPARGLEMIDDCACVAMEDDISGQAPALFVVWKKGAEADPVKLRTLLGEKLDKYRMPKEIYEIDHIPHSENGKILRRELRKLLPGKE